MLEDKNNTEFDLMMRSILQDGREEVPGHIWEAVSEGLDAAAHKKRIALWWRRAAVAGSIAAAFAVGLFFTFRDISAPEADSSMIAVVPAAHEEDSAFGSGMLVAEQTEIPDIRQDVTAVASSAGDFKKQIMSYSAEEEQMPDGESQGKVIENEGKGTSAEEASMNTEKTDVKDDVEDKHRISEISSKGTLQDFWPEEETSKEENRVKTSIVLSGVTGTNSTRSHSKQNLMKRPTVPSSKPQTGITETSTNTTYGIPLSFGTGVKFDFNKRWSVGTGINYTLLTRKFYGTYTKATPEGEVEFSKSSDIRNSQHYIGIPLNVFFNIVDNKYINFYAYAGGTAEKCISDRYEVLNVTGSRLTHREKVKGIQLSANIGIGAEFMTGEHLGIYIDPSLRYYFNNGQPKSIRTAQPLMLGFEMGLRVRL